MDAKMQTSSDHTMHQLPSYRRKNISSTVKMHGDLQPNVFGCQKGPFSYLDTYAYLHFRTLRISNTGTWVKYSWEKVVSSESCILQIFNQTFLLTY